MYPKMYKYHTMETFCIFVKVPTPGRGCVMCSVVTWCRWDTWSCVTWSSEAVWFSLFSTISFGVSVLTTRTSPVWLLSTVWSIWSICSGVLLVSDWSNVSNLSVVLLPEVAATYLTSTWSMSGVWRSRSRKRLLQYTPIMRISRQKNTDRDVPTAICIHFVVSAFKPAMTYRYT